MLKLAKNQANAMQQPEVEFLLFEIIHIINPCYHPKLIWNTLKNKQNNWCVCLYSNNNKDKDGNEK